jgi:hypothetical protein
MSPPEATGEEPVASVFSARRTRRPHRRGGVMMAVC